MQNNSPIYLNKVVKQTTRMLFTCLLAFFTMMASAQTTSTYTDDQPLVIVSDIEFPPYEFSNTYGQAVGFNIDVLEAILNQMNIPHKYVMREWNQASRMFENKEADLILDPIFKFNSQPYYSSRSIVNYYKIKIASRIDTPPITSFEQLKKADNIVMKSNDIASQKVIESIAPELQAHLHTTQDALAGVAHGKYRYFIWGEEPLKWKIRELDLENEILLNEIDIPAGEVHFVGYDPELINKIDDQFARMEQRGELEKIRDKWFNPEHVHNDTSPVVIYITAGILLLALLLAMVTWLIRQRVKTAARKNDDLANMMSQALSMGNYSVIFYNVKHNRFTNRHGHMIPDAGLSMQQFLECIHPDDRETTRIEMEQMVKGGNSVWEMVKRWNAGTAEAPDWQYMRGDIFTELDDEGKVHNIVHTIHNVTEEYEQEKRDNELASKYVKIFDSTLVAMSFYDKNGCLLDLNEKMRELYCVTPENEKRVFNENILTHPLIQGDFDPQSRDSFNVCQCLRGINNGRDRYVELFFQPIYEGNELQYYVATSRDITGERDMYLEQRQQDQELHQTNDRVKQYETELQYLLENSQMWVWRSNMKDRTIIYSRNLASNNRTIAFDDYQDTLYDDENRLKAMKAFKNMSGADVNFNVTLHFLKAPENGKEMWLAISGMPLHDEDGSVLGHFGVTRDVTPLMEAQEKLRQETNRAEDSGKLKSIFLANMTHEIRTPLNAIVGFSDLLKVIDNSEERHEFIRIIRNNCDMLIRLINDIIEASNMNRGPLAIEADDVDWAVAFNDICQTLAQRVQEPGVEFIVDNPYSSFLTCVDKGRLQQVITNFTTNAVKYTHKGHIKVGYRYEDGGIYMYCEDTGAGIPKEKQATVFERFVKLNDYVQGTGLGLSICKSIADRCGGRIGVTSEGTGHGSTFWIWIPCEHKNNELTN
jgi:PAS domain S-box-containing protein